MQREFAQVLAQGTDSITSMGLRINTLTSNAFSILEKKKAESGAQSRIISLDEIRVPAAPRTSPARNLRTQTLAVSNQISSVLTLGQVGLNDNQSSAKAKSSRQESLKGIGDRNVNIETGPAVLATKEFENSIYDAVTAETPTSAPTQQDFEQVRNAVLDVAQRAVRSDPAITDEDLETAVDASFGDGTSALFNVKSRDLGKGYTEVSVDQIEYSKLEAEDQETLKTASANTALNYLDQKLNPVVEGADVSELLGKIESKLGYRGLGTLEKVNQSLASGDYEEGLSDAKKSADAQGNKEAAALIEELQNTVKDAVKSYDSNPLSDASKFKFKSGRFDLAFGKDEVAAAAALTENATDRSPVFRKKPF